MAQGWFVHQKTPFEAGMFMLPVMVASGFGGPIAGMLVSKLGLRGGDRRDVAQRLQLFWAGADRFQHSAMVGLGADDAAGLWRRQRCLASSSAIMAAAPKEKAAAGAIETMAYELGAGLGIALFG